MSPPITDPMEIKLRAGGRATIRPIRRDDVARTAAFIDALSTQSKHALFLGGIVRFTDAEMQRLCNSHDSHDMAYVATVPTADGERQIGVCRYAGADSAEGADAGMDAASNDAMRRLARDVGFSERRDPDDIHQVIYSLQP